jgi:hypothetical protein
MLPGYPLVLAASTADGTANTGTTAVSILHGSGIATIPAGALQVGSQIKMLLRGRMNTVVTTPGTTTFDLRLGGVIVSALGAINLNTTAQTNATWELELLATIRSVGVTTGATAIVTGRFSSRAIVGGVAVATGGASLILLPDTAPAIGTGFDSTLALAVNVFCTNTVAGSITCHQSITELKV